MKNKTIEKTTQVTARFPDSIYAGIVAVQGQHEWSAAKAVIVLVREALEQRNLLNSNERVQE